MEKRKFRAITLLADIIILTISFIAVVSLKPSGLRAYIPSHTPFFIGLVLLWIIVSLLNGKMHRGKIVNASTLFSRVLSSNTIAISSTVLIMFLFREYSYSRTVVFGTAMLATFLELMFGGAYIAYKRAMVQDYEEYDPLKNYKRPSEYDMVMGTNGNGSFEHVHYDLNPVVVKAIEKECGAEMARAILRITGPKLSERSAVLSTTTLFNITGLALDKYQYIINLHRLNDIKNLNDFIEAVNEKLDKSGYFFCCVETKDQRKKRILGKFPPGINWIYYSADFLIKRVLPKIKFTRKLYFFLTRGENAVITRAEALGRLSWAGFIIKQESFIGNLLWIEARKYSAPVCVDGKVYGPLIALPRVGRNGELIKVYKLRTMHPYSEYIQDYVYKLHALQYGGKFKDDFRITSWGSAARRIWLDEVPMLINYLKGDMKLVGVRPLSKQYFGLYSKELQDRRTKYKPGLIPPYYADLPSTLEGIEQSEIRYLDSYDRSPVLTDVKYFFRSWYNIWFQKARSN
jgi:hypothetical protein